MPKWKVNLFVLWFGQFFAMAGMTMIIPFLSLYVQELGVTDPGEVAIWAGVIFAANFVTAFFFQPIWGRLSDKYGYKMMILRSGFGMSIAILLMGFATHPIHLLILRLFNGMISGFQPASISLMSATAPREKMGFALGTLQSGALAGTVIGPFIGGALAGWFGFRPIFYLTGMCMLIATLLVLFLVKYHHQSKVKETEKPISVLEGFRQLREIPQITALFVTSIFLQIGLLSTAQLIPLYLQEMHGQIAMLPFYAGLVVSAAGFSNVIASPLLGRLGDRIGTERILITSLLAAMLLSIPQAFATSVWQMVFFRFLLGIFVGGLVPSVNTLIRKYTPNGMEGRAYSFNTSANALGNLLAPTIGGLLALLLDIRWVFLVSAGFFAINLIWVRKTLLQPTRNQDKLKSS